MELSFKNFLSIVRPILDAKYPVMIRGRHGIGKSEVVYQIAKEIGLPVVERRASQMTEGDLIGLPTINGNATSWNPPDWFKQACEFPCMVFLDELDRAVVEVRQGIFELGDSRKLNGHTLHPDTIIMAAVNGGEHGAQYQVGEMDPAELDRWEVYDLDPSLEDWLDWGRDNNAIDNLILDFIRQNPIHLEHKKDFQANKKYPSRRSWKRLNNTLQQAGMLEEFDNKVRMLAVGFVGFEAAMAFSDFFQKYDRQVTPKDILDHGKFDLVKKFGMTEHCALVEKMKDMGVFANELTDNQMANFAKYFMMLPSEAAMLAWGAVSIGEVSNVPKFHQTEIDGMLVSSYFTEILTGKAENEKKEEEEKAEPAKKAAKKK